MFVHRVHRREDLSRLLTQLAQWDAGGRPVPGLHVGDLGWALRDPDDAWTVHGWWDADALLATALFQGPMARPRMAPDHVTDLELAGAVAETVETLPGAQLWSDAMPGTALRQVFIDRGWADDADDPWTCLHADLRRREASTGGDSVVEEARTCVEDRVSAQVAGFENSTFTADKWRRMAALEVYRPELDLVVRAGDGSPAATGTAWVGSVGGSAILEPVSTHRDFRRAGYGRRLVEALSVACRGQGAVGVTVWTPGSNDAAVAAYRSTGFEVVAEATAVTLDRRG